jgi:superfamily II DNA or RNA helicase
MFSEDDIRRAVSRNAFVNGGNYAAVGRVRDVCVGADGLSLTARVHGSRQRPYDVAVRIRQTHTGEIDTIGLCTCPVGVNCKHVAAAMIAALGRAPEAAPEAPPRLPDNLVMWLSQLEKASEPEDSEEYPDSVRHRLFYVLGLRADPTGPRVLTVDPLSVQMRRDGGFLLPPSQVSPNAATAPKPPKFLRPSDRRILRRLPALQYGATNQDEETVELLRQILATGRARWGGVDGPAVSEGPPRPGRLVWNMAEDGSQRPDLDLGDGALAFLLREPWYADPDHAVLGPVTLDLPARLACSLLAGPSLPPEAAALFRAEVARRAGLAALPVPRELAPPRTIAEPPRPKLRLFAGSLRFDPGEALRLGRRVSPYGEPRPVPMARLLFRYGPLTIDPEQPRRPMLHQGALHRVTRRAAAEAAFRATLDGLGLVPVERLGAWLLDKTHAHDWVLAEQPEGTDWLDLLLRDLPELERQGWAVEVAADFPLRLVHPAGEIEAHLREGSGIDWFELELGVTVDGERVDLVPALLRLIAAAGPGADPLPSRRERPLLVPLPDGRRLALPQDRIRPIVEMLLELFARTGEARAGFSRHDAADLATLAASDGVVWHGGEAVRELGRQLRETGGIPPVATPAGFAAALRPYQARGVDWLQFLRAAGLGGVLADDMGLGKTVQTLAHLAIELEAGRLDRPSLIVCPTSLVANWCQEAARFVPALRVLALQGPARKQHFAEIAAHDVVITTYPLLARDAAALAGQEWHLLVLDEAQNIKNPATEASKAVGRLRARQRLCLSGTPLQNHLGELWSLFHFLAPGFLGEADAFRKHFRTPIEKLGDEERRARLARRVRPFLLRRTKTEVAADLPPKTEILAPVEMQAAQRAMYESIRLAMHHRVREAIAERGLARSGIVILDALLKLRQVCCDPRLLRLKTAAAAKAGSAKLECLLDLLPQLLEEGRRVLLFSQFTSMLALIEQALAPSGIAHVTLTGQTRDREAPVRRFQAGEVPLFLISLKAGGTGLNLTTADTVILYDPWWNPAVEQQAADRAHRIGQDKAVFVHRLVTLGTIEEKMDLLKARKRELVAGILDAERGATLALSEADIEHLFAPAEAA